MLMNSFQILEKPHRRKGNCFSFVHKIILYPISVSYKWLKKTCFLNSEKQNLKRINNGSNKNAIKIILVLYLLSPM